MYLWSYRSPCEASSGRRDARQHGSAQSLHVDRLSPKPWVSLAETLLRNPLRPRIPEQREGGLDKLTCRLEAYEATRGPVSHHERERRTQGLPRDWYTSKKKEQTAVEAWKPHVCLSLRSVVLQGDLVVPAVRWLVLSLYTRLLVDGG